MEAVQYGLLCRGGREGRRRGGEKEGRGNEGRGEVGGKQGFLGSRELRRKAGARLGVGALVKRQEFLAHKMQRGLSCTASKFVLVRQITASPPLFRCASSKGGRRFGASPARIIFFEVGARLDSTPKKVVVKLLAPAGPSRARGSSSKNLPHSQGAEPSGPRPCFPPRRRKSLGLLVARQQELG
jgi:hypothetical protein